MICGKCKAANHEECESPGCDCQHRFPGWRPKGEIPMVANSPNTITVSVHNSNGADLFYCGRSDNYVDDENVVTAKSDSPNYRIVSQMVTGTFRVTIEEAGE